MDEEFSNNNYKASPDGVYAFELKTDSSALDYDLVKKLHVKMSGSYIPFKNKKLKSIAPIIY